MLKCVKFVVLAGLILAFTGTAGALSLVNGPNKGKYSDYGSFYSVPTAGGVDAFGRPYQSGGPRPGQTYEPLANPAGAFIPVFPGDVLRDTFLISSIDRDTLPNPAGNDFNDSVAEQLAGMLYDLELDSFVRSNPADPTSGGTLYLIDANTNGIVGRPVLSGGVIEIWTDLDPNTAYNPVSVSPDGIGFGPSAWDEADSFGHVAGAFGHAVGPDTFPTVNQEGQTLLLQGVFIPFPETPFDPVPAGTLLRETVTGLTSNSTGEGSGYIMITGGSMAPFIGVGGLDSKYIDDGGYLGGGALPAGLTADLFIQFDLKPDEIGAPPWGNVSEDPFRFNIVPEPMTMIAVGMSIAGLGGYIRKRRMA